MPARTRTRRGPGERGSGEADDPAVYGGHAADAAGVADYYHEISELDKEVGMCLGLLDKHGLTDKTLTVYCSEQGAQFPHAKWTCYDLGIKGQFIARWPGKIAAGSTSDALMGYMDFVPTAVEAGGGKPIDGLDGQEPGGAVEGGQGGDT